LRYWSRALEFDPNVQTGWVGQVRMLIELGELEEARLWADKGLDVHRDDAELLAANAIATARLGDAAKALGFCDLALKKKGGPSARRRRRSASTTTRSAPSSARSRSTATSAARRTGSSASSGAARSAATGAASRAPSSACSGASDDRFPRADPGLARPRRLG